MGADLNAPRGAGRSPFVIRLGASNGAALAVGVIATLALRPSMTAGFVIGYGLGVLNLAWLLRIAGRGTRMTADKAGRYVARNYYLRFVLTAVVFALLIIRGVMSEPWHPIAGLTACIFVTVAVLIFSAREEASEQRCTT